MTVMSNRNKMAEYLSLRVFENGISTTLRVATCDVNGGYYEVCTTCNGNVNVSKIYTGNYGTINIKYINYQLGKLTIQFQQRLSMSRRSTMLNGQTVVNVLTVD